MKIPFFYNAIKEDTNKLEVSNQKAKNQEEVIYNYIVSYGECTPFEASVILPNVPITSIRRAITNLEKRGKLTKTGVKIERYGKPNNVWGLK